MTDEIDTTPPPHPVPRPMQAILFAGLVTLACWLFAETVAMPWMVDQAAQQIVREWER